MPDTCSHHTSHVKEISQIREATNTNTKHIEQNRLEIVEVKKTHEILIGLKKDMEIIKTQIQEAKVSRLTYWEMFLQGAVTSIGVGAIGIIFWIIIQYGSAGGTL